MVRTPYNCEWNTLQPKGPRRFAFNGVANYHRGPAAAFVRFQLVADLDSEFCGFGWPDFGFTPLPEGVRYDEAEAEQASLSTVWGDTLERDFQNLRKAIVDRVTLSHPDPIKSLVLHTDASQEYFAGILTQIPEEDLDKEADDKRHEPLAFVSGRFSGPSLNWSVPEKEAYAILFGMTRLRYLTLVNTVNVFTDHKNLVYIHDPTSTNPQMASDIVSQQNRWGIILSEFDYVVHHADGEVNYFTDMMTRWAASSVTYIVGSVSIVCNDACTRVLSMFSNRIHICVVIYICYHIAFVQHAINTSHVIDCKESETGHTHTCLEISSRH
jgi:RNase H-like domain found in reverse transcriptase